jgi:hypothetical protein
MVKKKEKIIEIIPIDTDASPSSGEVDDRTREFPLFSSSLLRGKGARGGIGGLASVRLVAVGA